MVGLFTVQLSRQLMKKLRMLKMRFGVNGWEELWKHRELAKTLLCWPASNSSKKQKGCSFLTTRCVPGSSLTNAYNVNLLATIDRINTRTLEHGQ